MDTDVVMEDVGDITRFRRHTIGGHVFELTRKYVPPTKILGKGSYGIVCSSFNSMKSEHVAIKKVSNVFLNKETARRMLREMRILHHLRQHDNIIKIRDIIPPFRMDVFNDVYIVYELMDSDLYSIIYSGKPYADNFEPRMLCQMLGGLAYMHSLGVIHRDLKPRNILVNRNGMLKIGDFNAARFKSVNMTKSIFSNPYRAPEVILESPDYTSAVDMWAIGCIFLEMMFRRIIFKSRDTYDILSQIMELTGSPSDVELSSFTPIARGYVKEFRHFERHPINTKFPGIDPGAADLVTKMLCFDPKDRISAADALTHPYLSAARKELNYPSCHEEADTVMEEEYDNRALSVDHLKELIRKEIIRFNPEHS